MLGMSFKYLRTVWLPGPSSGLQPVTLAPKMSDLALCHHNHATTHSISPAHVRGKGEGRLLTKHRPRLLTAPTSNNPIPRLQLITTCSTKKTPSSAQHSREGSPQSLHTHTVIGKILLCPTDSACPGMGQYRGYTISHGPELIETASFPHGNQAAAALFGHLQINAGAAGRISILQYMHTKICDNRVK